MWLRRLLPAVPTVILSGLLAVDFHGLLYTLYLEILIYYPATILLEIVLVVVFKIKKREWRHPLTLAALILLLSTVLMPLISIPVHKGVRLSTGWNRVFAVVRTTYELHDKIEFTITAHGAGSKTHLFLNSGYTNIAMNENYGRGPSFHYRLRPEIEIRVSNRYVPLNEASVALAFEEKGLGFLTHTDADVFFRQTLEHMARVGSVNEFHSGHANQTENEISLMPYENAVHRIAFFFTSLTALVISARFTRNTSMT